MASELFMFENSFSVPFSPFNDHHHHPHDDDDDDIFQTMQRNNFIETNSFQETSVLTDHHQNTSSLEQNLSSLCQTIQSANNGSNSGASMEVKSEECNVPFETNNNYGYTNSYVPQGTTHNAVLKLMQRSYSSNSFDGKPSNFLFQPCFDNLMESSSNFHNQVVSSPESCFSSTQMRRVCSTGDLPTKTTTPTRNILPSSPLSTEKSYIEDAANMKVGRYSAEQRKERIDRYRAKRIRRNFNKKIKYACRKTLADSRPRVRGRFARNDEAGAIPNTGIFNRYRYEDENFWVETLQEENDGSVRRAPFLSSFCSRQGQYYMY